MPPDLTAAQLQALEVLAYAHSHGLIAETAQRSEVQFPRTLPPGRPRVSAGAARTLIAAGYAATETGLPGCRRLRLTDAGVALCDAAGISGEVAA